MKALFPKLRLFFLFLTFFTFAALTADEYTVYGLARLSSQEQNYLEDHVHKVIEVLPNDIGLDRISTHLEENNISAEDFSISNSALEFNALKTSSKEAAKMIGAASTLPPRVNNSLLPSFPPIGDQGQIGSCVGWGSTYYQATHELGLLNGFNNKTSSTHVLSPKWTYDMINGGQDRGSSVADAYQLLSTNGATTILTSPYDTNYTSWNLNAQDWISAISNRMSPYVLIPGLNGNLTAIKQALNNGHVLTFATFINSWVFTIIKHDPSNINNFHEGEYACIYMNGQKGGHFMTIVGYDDTLWIDVNGSGSVDSGERGAFLIANSWGSNWGNSGFIWISYDAFLASSAVPNGPRKGRVPAGSYLNSSVISMLPKALNYSPSLYAEFSLSQTRRNQIIAQVGASNTNQSAPASFVPILNQQGGSLEFDGVGSSTLGTVTFAADLTDLLPSGSTSANRYYLSVADAARGDATTLNSYILVDPIHNRQTRSSELPKIYDNSQGTIYLDYAFQTAPPSDTTPPNVSITSPSNGATLSGAAPITIEASDNVAVASVALYVDSTLLKTWTAAPYQFSLNTATLSNGSHQIQAVATDYSNNTTRTSIAVQVQNKTAIYTNAGGPAVSFGGSTWNSDSGVYSGQTSTMTSSLPFANPIYATERSGNMTYSYSVPNGKYLVTLKFAENTFKKTKQRIFNVFINGSKAISNLDLFSKAGFGKPYDLTFSVTVTNNNLSLVFSAKKNKAKISGIQIISK